MLLTYFLLNFLIVFSEAVQSDQTYQEEFNPPPEGSATGIGKQEKVVPIEDPDHNQEQVQHRLVDITTLTLIFHSFPIFMNTMSSDYGNNADFNLFL